MMACTRKEKVDFIVRNAVVYTVDSSFSVVQSFAVRQGKIVACGDNREIDQHYFSDQIVDVQNAFIYPGFNDAHCHFSGYAGNLVAYADLSGTKSPNEVYERLQKHYAQYGGTWVLGRGWDQNDWENYEFPDRTQLDELFPDIPVYLIRIDGHAAWCNEQALKVGGITGALKIEGGEIVQRDGWCTGILIDNAMSLVQRHIPPLDLKKLRHGLLRAQNECFSVGLTSVSDCGVDKNTVLLYREMHENKELKMRVNAMLSPTSDNFSSFVEKGPLHTERLTVNTIKIFADGALGSRGALLFQDYSDDPGNRGVQINSEDYYLELCHKAYRNYFAVAAHAIGDSANRIMLSVYGRVLKGQNDRRWRIEHAQVVHPDDFAKFREFSVIPSVQATHCTSDMYWVEQRLGPQRAKGAYAYQTLLQQNGWLPNGTDFPVENIHPLYTFFASVFRTDYHGFPEGGWHKHEGLTREQALRSMTVWPAKAAFEEKEKGSLEPGKWADFVVLDTDLMHASPKQVLNAHVLSTWIAGEQVFKRK